MQSNFDHMPSNMKSYNNSTVSAGVTKTFVRPSLPPEMASADLSFISGGGNQQNYLS